MSFFQPVKANKEYFRYGYFYEDLVSGIKPLLIDPNLFHSTPYSMEKYIKESSSKEYLPRNFSFNSSYFIENEYKIGFLTSGTTGEPKVFSKSKDHLVSEIQILTKILKEFIPFESTLPFLVSTPLCHLYGFLWGFLLPIYLQWSAYDTEGIRDTIQKLQKKSYIWITVPSILKSLLELQNLHPKSFQPFLVISSGSFLDTSIARSFEKLLPAQIIEIYGSTETGGIAWRLPGKEEIFHPLPKVSLCIQEEYICVQSPWISPECELVDGFFRTSDTGSLSSQGIYHQGRKDRIVKRNARRIHLDAIEKEIENLLPSVECIAVEWEQEKIGILVAGKIQESEFYNKIQEQLHKYYIPDRVLFVENLPKTQTGKKDYYHAKKILAGNSGRLPYTG